MLLLTAFTCSIVVAVTARTLSGYATTFFILPVFAWYFMPNRYYAFAVMFGHYLGYGFPLAVSPYFDNSLMYGLGAWIGQASVMSLPFLLWFNNKYMRCVSLILILIITAVAPPFLFISYGHPFIALGYLFPMSGWFGFIVLALLISVMCIEKIRIYFGIAGLALALTLNLFYDAPAIHGWAGLMTKSKEDTRSFKDMYFHIQSLKSDFEPEYQVVMIPEGNFRMFTNTAARELSNDDRSRIILVCADKFFQDNKKAHRGIYLVEDGKKELVYLQHMPPPGAMWTPWDSTGFLMRYTGSSTFEVSGTRSTALICYEMLLPWVNIKAHLESPDVVFATLNEQPVADTTIPRNQIATVESFARLFSKPTVISSNSYKENNNE